MLIHAEMNAAIEAGADCTYFGTVPALRTARRFRYATIAPMREPSTTDPGAVERIIDV